MAAGRGDLERPPGGALPAHLGEVGPDGAGARGEDGLHVEARQVARDPALQQVDRGAKGGRPEHLQPRHEPGLGGVPPRHDQPPPSGAGRVLGHGERARHRPQRAVERQLPHRADAREGRRRHLPGRGQGRQRERQVVLGPGLAEVGGREVGDDPAGRHGEGLVREPGADALARLLHRRVGQPDHRERRKAGPQVHLDLHGRGLESEDRGAEHVGDHGEEAGTGGSHRSRVDGRCRPCHDLGTRGLA